jgi:hypothetical protein
MNIKYGFTVRVYCRLKVLLMGRRKVFEFHRHVLCSMSESIFLLLFLLDEAAVCNASLNHPSSRYTRFAKVAGDASKSRACVGAQSVP